MNDQNVNVISLFARTLPIFIRQHSHSFCKKEIITIQYQFKNTFNLTLTLILSVPLISIHTIRIYLERHTAIARHSKLS